MNDSPLYCQDESRRDDVRAAPLYGLDYVEVSDDQTTLTVVFLGKAPPGIEKENVRIAGGRRLRDIRVLGITLHRQKDPTLDDAMDVRVDKPGDFSTYTLSLVTLDERGHSTGQPFPGFDPRYDTVAFSFKAACPSDVDCKAEPLCPPPSRTQPEIDYLAKDYASFRQLILDRLALIMPDWRETHVPDIGIALVELLAYVGDYLSYYQDAVATEAYLGTARQRISVRRHARLVDYPMHDGSDARAWVTIQTDADGSLDPRQVYFITGFPGAPAERVLSTADLINVPLGSYEVFEPLVDPAQPIQIHAEHTEMHFYTWGDSLCCLAKGATSATLVDRWVPASGGTAQGRVASARTDDTPSPSGDGPPGTARALRLRVGDVLMFEEVVGPRTGNPADADPTHRQAVRLTKVEPAVDPLYHPASWPDYGQPVLEIEWCPGDSLTFPLCISTEGPPPECAQLENVSVARGNVILVDNGASGSEPLGTVPTRSTVERCPTECDPSEVEVSPGLFRPVVSQAPLTFSQPIPPDACCAGDMIDQDPRSALPSIRLRSIPPAPACPPGSTPPCQIPPLFTFGDLADPRALAKVLKAAADPNAQFLLAQLTAATRTALAGWDGSSPPPAGLLASLAADLTSLLEIWTPRRDLLESGPDDKDFVAEMDDDGLAHLRFGDGQSGRVPDAGMAFEAQLRVGNGPSGNVGAETITYLVLRDVLLSGVNLRPRNPMPATGGTSPEPLAEVKLFAPSAFRDVLERAITADDYAQLASDNGRRRRERPAVTARAPADVCLVPFQALQGAKATLRWTGSWYEATVAIDPAGTGEADPALVREVTRYLEPYRRMGHDLRVEPAEYVPLDLGLTVCVLPNYLRAHVEAATLAILSNRVLPDGRLGFFHPDNLSFGEDIYASRIVAAVQAVPGVQNVKITRLERFEASEPPPLAEAPEEEVPADGVLRLGALEIARLDNDPSLPENGRLTLDLRGGR